MKKNGIDPKDLARIEKEEPELWDKITATPGGIRDRAKQLTAKQKKFYEAGRLGMIIDGTGHVYEKIAKNKTNAGVFKFTAKNVPAKTPSTIKIPKVLTILKSTASCSI